MKKQLYSSVLIATATTVLVASPWLSTYATTQENTKPLQTLSPKAAHPGTDTLTLPDSVLHRYAGDYYIADVNVTVTFAVENHQLVVHREDGQKIPLIAKTQTHFIAPPKDGSNNEGAGVEFSDIVDGEAQTASMIEGDDAKVAKRKKS